MAAKHLHTYYKTLTHTWRQDPIRGYATLKAAHEAYLGYGETVRKALPFPTSIAYAYSPRENTGSRGGSHIVAGEAFERGKLKRVPGDTLCQGKANEHFWGLEPSERNQRADCLKCLTIAERLIGLDPNEEIGLEQLAHRLEQASRESNHGERRDSHVVHLQDIRAIMQAVAKQD